MSWIHALYDTYNSLEQEKDIFRHKGLLKMAHSTQNAHVEMTIDIEGNFKNAEFVEKERASTVIPVSEASASRSSGVTPHPLFDKLKYIAGDYEVYSKEKNAKHHEAYMTLLNDWCESDYSDDRIKAIYHYLNKGSIIKDLVNSNILSTNETNMLTKKWDKATGHSLSVGNQIDAFVRIRVIGGAKTAELWQDEELQDKYIAYYLSRAGEDKFCYVTGKVQRVCGNHPSKIRNTGDKAKLISSNDMTNFTFRGRFRDPEQAYTISYEASQKVHNALKWLIKNQGVKVGDKVFVLWGVCGEDVPDILADTLGLLGDESKTADTKEKIADAFNKAITGYKAPIKSDSQLALLGLDAATTGRLSVTFYREYNGLQGNELINNIAHWHNTCKWKRWYKTAEGQSILYEGAPAPIDIAKAAYGTDQNGKLKGSDKLFAQTVERLILCICDKQRIPQDIVRTVVTRAKMPQNYNNNYLWLQVMSTACALYRRYLSDYNEEEITMEIQDSKDINYNCGRLLAIADAIENWALRDKADDPKKIRTTTAVRYFTRFCQQPCETWSVINMKLSPYKEQLGGKATNLYKLLGEVSAKIDVDEFKQITNLDGAFCLGFDTQRMKIIDDASQKKKQQ